MKKLIAIAMAVALLLALTGGPAVAAGGGGGINNPPGNPLYVIIEVTWDGDPDNGGAWTVWGPKWAPVVGTGTVLTSCTDCLDMSGYTFTFHGKTVHFDEEYVSGVDACPQVHHVVLRDLDGDGTYTGSDPASKYTFPTRPGELYHDRIDYEISFDSSGGVTNFRYLEYEHRKQ
jgi:hypothetical protein